MKDPRSLLMVRVYFLYPKALIERNRILECRLNMAVKEGNLLVNAQQ